MSTDRRFVPSRRVLAVGAIAGGVLVAAGCGSVGFLAGGNASAGKPVFVAKCGSCHVLDDAGTKGTIGPDLDASFFQFRRDIIGDEPSKERIDRAESTIRQVVRGQIAYPIVRPSTGAPGMPANIVEGEEADNVAAYVASAAGTGESIDR